MQRVRTRRVLLYVAVLLPLGFLIPTVILAQEYSIPWSVMGSGGGIGDDAGGSVLSSTYGQAIVGMVTQGSDTIYQGFWLPVRPIIGGVDIADRTAATGAFKLRNYPNPFSTTTTIGYTIGARSRVTLAIYDLLGNDVAFLLDEIQEPGEHATEWNGLRKQGDRASAGVYLYVLSVQSPNGVSSSSEVQSERRKLVLVR